MRRVGQTQQQLQTILDELAHGSTITYYVWPTSDIVYPFDLMGHLLDYQYEAAERSSRNRLCIQRNNGAEICFISYQSVSLHMFRGRRNLNLVFDHACGSVPHVRHYANWQDVERYLCNDVHARDAMLDRALWMTQAHAVYTLASWMGR